MNFIFTKIEGTILLMGTTGFAPHEHVVFTEFDAGEGILVDLNTKKYFQLNETALIVWRGIENDRTLDEIVGEITTAYDVTPERATESVHRLLENLRAFKLVRRR